MKSPTSAPFSDISTDEFFGCYLVALLSCVCCAFIAKRRYRKDAAALSLTRWTSEEVLTFTLHNAIAGIWAVILLAGHERPTPLSILQVIAFDVRASLQIYKKNALCYIRLRLCVADGLCSLGLSSYLLTTLVGRRAGKIRGFETERGEVCRAFSL